MNAKKQIVAAVLLALAGAMQAAEYVTVDNPGNPADSGTGYGAVNYAYQISKTEVSVAEYQASGAGNGNENYWNDGIRTLGSAAPATYVCWYEAAQYCNWLTTGDIFSGAYQLDSEGFVTNVMTRAQILADGGLFYVLPTEDEWYKAAFYNGSGYSLYANGTDTVPGTSDARYANTGPWVAGSGTTEQNNNTYDMMGNVWEWTESAWDGTLNDMSENIVIRGGAYDSNGTPLSSSARYWEDPLIADANVGFRVVAIPEPATTALLGMGSLGIFGVRRLRRKGLGGFFDFSRMGLPLMFMPVQPAVAAEEPVRDIGEIFWRWQARLTKKFARLPQKTSDLLLALLVPEIFVRSACPDCDTLNIRRSHHSLGKWARRFHLKRYVCKDCGRRFISGA
jgi:sulfatase modifying factor 1